jgi:hypothetical protein
MRLRGRGELKLIGALAAELARSREREGVLRERNEWYRAALENGTMPGLRLVGGQADWRSEARRTAR